MKILVVGGAGYIGSICAEVLLDRGHEVAILDNLSEGHRHALDPRAEFIEGDLADRKMTKVTLARLRPDAVMHFAANALVGESMENPSKYFRNNSIRAGFSGWAITQLRLIRPPSPVMRAS